MEKRYIYDDEVFESIKVRLEKLNPDSPSVWGSMNPAQMLAHCAEVQEVTNGKALTGTPILVKLMGGLIRKIVLSEKPYRRDGRTHPQYVVADPKDFVEQKSRLLKAIDEMRSQSPTSSKHPIFGKMSADDKGWAMYKHLDHHFTQFGI